MSPATHARPRHRLMWIVPPLVGIGAWTPVAVTHLLGVRLADLWILGLAVYAMVWLLAIAATVVGVVLLWRRHGRRAGAITLLCALLAAAAVVVVNWTAVYARGYYRVYRDDFAAVSRLASGGELESREYYGRQLPQPLRHLSANEYAVWISSLDGGRRALFLPAWTGIPDGAAGYAYHPDPLAAGTRFDCFGDPCRSQWTVGDGWIWLG